MTSKIISLPSAEELLKTLAVKLQPLLKANTALVGIQSGGVWLMQRLLVLLEKDLSASAIEHGTLDVSFYRDDYEKRGLKAENRPSQIPFDVEDCLLYTSQQIIHYSTVVIRVVVTEWI